MVNNMEMELYNDLRSVCNYAINELNVAYNYFNKISDCNGICILFKEINDFFDLYRALDCCDPRRRDQEIMVPTNYEWGFYHASDFQAARAKADNSVLVAIEQRKTKSNSKLYMPNGSFYGYYCYNVYNKCLGWANYSIQKLPKPSFGKCVVEYFESAMQYFMRFEDR